MTRTCIIGVSGYARLHYDLLCKAQAAGDAAIVGAAIINQDEEAEKCAALRRAGCRIFDDYRVMLGQLAGMVDLCIIPTGIHLHCPMTVAALETGMHVLVEKPAAGCIADVRLMQAAAEKAKRMVALGYQHMYTTAAQLTKEHLLGGVIGDLVSMKCLVTWPRDHAYYHRNAWTGRLTVEGRAVNDTPFNNAVAHDLMMLLFLGGETMRHAATPVAVVAELYRANAIESADTAGICIETAEGVPIRFYCTHACQTNFGPEIQITGTAGSIFMTHRGARIVPVTGDPIEIPVTEGDCGRQRMLDAVIDAINGGRSFYCDLDMASHQTEVVSMVHEACQIQQLEADTETLATGIRRTFIPGIESILDRAFTDESKLSEAGLKTERRTK